MADDGSADAGQGVQSDVPSYQVANLAAVLEPPQSGDDPAGIGLAGAYISARVTPGGVLRVSIELRGAQEWLRRPDGTVPLQVDDEVGTLFTGGRRPPDPASDADPPLPKGKVIPLKRGRPGSQPPVSNL